MPHVYFNFNYADSEPLGDGAWCSIKPIIYPIVSGSVVLVGDWIKEEIIGGYCVFMNVIPDTYEVRARGIHQETTFSIAVYESTGSINGADIVINRPISGSWFPFNSLSCSWASRSLYSDYAAYAPGTGISGPVYLSIYSQLATSSLSSSYVEGKNISGQVTGSLFANQATKSLISDSALGADFAVLAAQAMRADIANYAHGFITYARRRIVCLNGTKSYDPPLESIGDEIIYPTYTGSQYINFTASI